MMAHSERSYTEQERVLVIAAMFSAWRWLIRNPELKARCEADETIIQSWELANVAGLPVEVVEAAMRNHVDLGNAEHR